MSKEFEFRESFSERSLSIFTTSYDTRLILVSTTKLVYSFGVIWCHLVLSFTEIFRKTVETEKIDLHWSAEVLPTCETVCDCMYCKMCFSILLHCHIVCEWNRYHLNILIFFWDLMETLELSVSLNVYAYFYEVLNIGWYWRQDRKPYEPNTYKNIFYLNIHTNEQLQEKRNCFSPVSPRKV